MRAVCGLSVRSWVIGIAILAGLSVANSAAATGLVDTLKRVKPSVVGIGTFAPLRQPRSVFAGTGWIVADGRHAITNYHVVKKPLKKNKQETHAVFVPRKGKQPKAYKAKILHCDKRHDLCVLRIQGLKLPALKLGHATDVQEGELYAMTGFPIGMVLGLYPVTSQGIVAARTPIAIPSVSAKTLTQSRLGHLSSPYDVFQLDAIAYPGNSGSPLYNINTGKVIGVVNSVFVKGSKEAALERPSGISYAIPVTHVYDLLNKARLKP